MTLPVRHVRFRVAGRVQGVGFRYFTRTAAEALGLSGWVRNLPGGDVEGEAEGDAAAVAEFLDELGGGPDWGHVSRLDVEESDLLRPSAEGSSAEAFEIRR